MAPAPGCCAERQKLTQKLHRAMRQLAALTSMQMKAVAEDRILTDEFQQALQRAQKARAVAHDQLMSHVTEHHCEG
jgi:hypothetical protein